jgi:transcriptional regulator with XRE-family HTH domain
MKLLSERLKWAMQQKSERDGFEVLPADIARAANASSTSASYWLSDTFGISAAKARKVAEYLGVNPYWLETGTGEPAIDYVAPTAQETPKGGTLNADELMVVMSALRDGEELERDMLVSMARTINAKAALRRQKQ